MLRAALWLALGLVTATSARAQEPQNKEDVRYHRHRCSGMQLWETELFDKKGVALTIRKTVVPLDAGRADTIYSFMAERKGHDALMFKGPSQWRIDGERISAGREEDGSRIVETVASPNGLRFMETAYYWGVPPAFIQRLAHAGEAELRLPGKRGDFSRNFDQKPQERLRRFLLAAVTPEEPEATQTLSARTLEQPQDPLPMQPRPCGGG